MEYYNKNYKQVLKELNTSTEGLASQDAENRLQKYGYNEINHGKPKNLWAVFFKQFSSVLVLVLIVAGILSTVLGAIEGNGYLDGVVIFAIVIINAVLGFLQEKKAESSLALLEQVSLPKAKVIRDGVVQVVLAKELVVGDIVTLETGDYIPADLRLISSSNLKVDEAVLTGESVSSSKDYSKIIKEKVGVADRSNCVFMSTFVTYGRATGVVILTGEKTQVGELVKLLKEHSPQKTPLEKKIDSFAKVLTLFCVVIVLIIMVMGLLQGRDFYSVLMIAISLAVAGIPEGLPAVVTIVLAVGMQRMGKKRAIIKNLSSVETLGSTTVICTDKTGTLTQNKMFVVKMSDTEKELGFSGTGYLYDGEIINDGDYELSKNFNYMLLNMALCNDSKIISGKNQIIGDPTEAALRVASYKAGYEYEVLEKQFERIKELPFDSERKLMSVLVKNRNNNFLTLTKGAVDSLLDKCAFIMINNKKENLTKKHINKIKKLNENYSKQALRVLGYAYKNSKTDDIEEEELIFVGLSAMEDPPRAEAMSSILKCKEAGIRVVMITGDHKLTAEKIGENLGICEPNDKVLSGVEIDSLSESELIEECKNVNIFARVSPKNKVQILNCIKQQNNIVAMTGDGVNDAPALKNADIGVAMGRAGTDVAKKSADMILTDDNFSSIVSAVEEGRVVYSNIKKFLSFLISCNIGEILVITIAILFTGMFGGYLPLLPLQILWVNLITDSLVALALGLERIEENTMKEKPKDPAKSITDIHFFARAIMQACGLALAVLCVFKIGLVYFTPEIANTMAFITIIFAELFKAFSTRNENKSILSYNPFSNKFLNYSVIISIAFVLSLVYIPGVNQIFSLIAVDFYIFWTSIVFALISLSFSEFSKLFFKEKE